MPLFVFVFLFALWLRGGISTSLNSHLCLSTNLAAKACLYNMEVGEPLSGAPLDIFMQAQFMLLTSTALSSGDNSLVILVKGIMGIH